MLLRVPKKVLTLLKVPKIVPKKVLFPKKVPKKALKKALEAVGNLYGVPNKYYLHIYIYLRMRQMCLDLPLSPPASIISQDNNYGHPLHYAALCTDVFAAKTLEVKTFQVFIKIRFLSSVVYERSRNQYSIIKEKLASSVDAIAISNLKLSIADSLTD